MYKKKKKKKEKKKSKPIFFFYKTDSVHIVWTIKYNYKKNVIIVII